MRYLYIVCTVFSLVLLASKSYSQPPNVPVYAAYVSEQLKQQCLQSACQVDSLGSEKLSSLISSLTNADKLVEALASSEYEVLIGNALINISEETRQAELVLEITTSWRKVPIDDLVLRSVTSVENIQLTASNLLAKWAEHLEQDLVLEANRIYQVLGASDYAKELQIPNTIGDFTLMQSAIYRDPLLGSISRYAHPQFDNAVVDISVYPFSKYGKTTPTNGSAVTVSQSSNEIKHPWLAIEMENELAQIKSLINQAKIEDFEISAIETAAFLINGQAMQGLRIEVLLNAKVDPIYSTQYVFQQNDKIIKVTGNLPNFMMSELVSESLPKIKVPGESTFMRSLRKG